MLKLYKEKDLLLNKKLELDTKDIKKVFFYTI